MIYRATPVAANGKSPAQIMTQREMKMRLPCLDRRTLIELADERDMEDMKQSTKDTSISVKEYVPCLR